MNHKPIFIVGWVKGTCKHQVPYIYSIKYNWQRDRFTKSHVEATILSTWFIKDTACEKAV